MYEIDERKKYRIEKEPPEGGWGYLIGIGMALPFVSNISSFFHVFTFSA